MSRYHSDAHKQGRRPAAGDLSSAEAYHARLRKRRQRNLPLRIIGAVVLLDLLFLLVTGIHMAVSVHTVRTEASSVKQSLSEGDAAGLQAAAGAIQGSMHTVDFELHTLPWQLMTYLPGVGPDVSAVQRLAATGARLTDDALVPFADQVAGSQIAPLFQDGKVDIPTLEVVSAAYTSVEPAVRSGLDDLAGLPDGNLPLARWTFSKLKATVGEAGEALDLADAFLPYAPRMLGGDGQPRNYLLIAQNNSELRATGGFAGSWILVTADDGAIQIGESQKLQSGRDYSFSITDDERNFIGFDMAINPANLNFTPDFTRAGALFIEAWETYTQQTVDGVVAMDPVFLQDLLALTGGITAPDGETVDGTNAAAVLLHDTYFKYATDTAKQDEYFDAVAGACTQQIMGHLGDADLGDLIHTVRADAAERRLYAYMVDPDEEAAMHKLGLAGALSTDPAKPVLGVYVNDNTWAKMCWYERIQTVVGDATRNADGSMTYAVQTMLTNTATEDELADAPEYVTGYSPAKRDVNDIFSAPVILMAPAGGTITNMQVDGEGTAGEGSLYGFDAWLATANMEPQETVTFAYDVTTAPGAAADLTVDQTPTAQRFE